MLTLAAQEASTHYMLGHVLGPRYHKIDDQLTEHQSQGIGLDTVTKEAKELLIAKAIQSAQSFIGQPISNDFRNHQPKPPTFF